MSKRISILHVFNEEGREVGISPKQSQNHKTYAAAAATLPVHYNALISVSTEQDGESYIDGYGELRRTSINSYVYPSSLVRECPA